MNHVMLDLETWGTRPGSAIRSIGAVVFDPYSETLGAEFYANIDDESCEEAGLAKDPDTVRWWASQSDQAKESLLVDQVPLQIAALDFNSWWKLAGAVYVWSQGANFDEPLWQAAANAVLTPPLWKFWDARDTRTVYDVCKFDPRQLVRKGTYHNALDDAKHQARCVQRALARLMLA